MRTALTRPPDAAIARCELTFLERRPIDPAGAVAEHAALERVLVGLGCEVLRLPSLPGAPDATFVEDVAIVLDEVAIVTRPGAPSRRPETAGLADVLGRFRPVREIEAPGTLDGGDVLRHGRTLYVGRSRRTDDAGIGRLRALVAPWDYRVVPVAVDGCLHLKSAACALDGDTILVNPAWVDTEPLEATLVTVDAREPFAANVLRVGATLVTADGHPHTLRRLEAGGYDVCTTPLRELMKAEAGVTCCCVLVEDARPSAA